MNDKMNSNKDDLKTEELIKSIRSKFRHLKFLLTYYENNESQISTINELFKSLNNYENSVPLKYKNAFLRRLDELTNEFTTKKDLNKHKIQMCTSRLSKNLSSRNVRKSKDDDSMESPQIDPLLARRLRRI